MISCNNRLRLWLYLLNFLLWFCLCRSLFFFLFKITLKYAVKCICVRCNLWFFLLRLYTCSRLRKNCFSAKICGADFPKEAISSERSYKLALPGHQIFHQALPFLLLQAPQLAYEGTDYQPCL